jgi:hypothetical protein
MPLKLNLGCGSRHRPGWINVDREPACRPDRVVDLERLPWPWETSSAEAVEFCHSLEHLGAGPEIFLGIVKELWRVCRPDALVTIIAPHVRSDGFLSDPTHVRPIMVEGLALFDQRLNRRWQDEGKSNTPLGLMLGVDFRIEGTEARPAEPWLGRLKRGEISDAVLLEAARTYNNVIEEVTIRWRAVKA